MTRHAARRDRVAKLAALAPSSQPARSPAPSRALAGAQVEEQLAPSVVMRPAARDRRTTPSRATMHDRAGVRRLARRDVEPPRRAHARRRRAERIPRHRPLRSDARGARSRSSCWASSTTKATSASMRVSSADARGFMQVMPFWVRLIGTPDQNLFQLRTNLRYGCTILRHYLDVENGDLYRALGRYNGSLGRPEYPTAVMTAAQALPVPTRPSPRCRPRRPSAPR